MRKFIQRKALEIWRESGSSGVFFTSNGWLQKFMNRHNFTLRRVINTGLKVPDDCVDCQLRLIELPVTSYLFVNSAWKKGRIYPKFLVQTKRHCGLRPQVTPALIKLVKKWSAVKRLGTKRYVIWNVNC